MLCTERNGMFWYGIKTMCVCRNVERPRRQNPMFTSSLYFARKCFQNDFGLDKNEMVDGLRIGKHILAKVSIT